MENVVPRSMHEHQQQLKYLLLSADTETACLWLGCGRDAALSLLLTLVLLTPVV